LGGRKGLCRIRINLWVVVKGNFGRLGSRTKADDQLYFILILYSYAAHLRSSTYHALPLTSRSKATQIAHPTTEADLEAELNNEEFEAGASNGDVGKGNSFVGKRESIEESRMENGQASAPRTGEGRKDKGKGRGGEDDDFSWD
jgi:hypothetical protein